MLTYNELKEKCNCWKGYKRVPGTKPCAEDSCMKEELEKHHVLAFGRMNPITSGHEAVVNKLHSVAKEHGASHSLVVSHSQDAKKNPLTGEQKVAHAKNAFPGTKVSSASKESPTILHHAAAAHAAGATHLHVIAGSDRHEEMHNLLHKYNGKDSGHGHYNFKKITVHSSGERDPDAEGTTGISASKMREHAASGNKAEFHKGAPSKMKPEHKDAMYNDVRKGMNIKEETVQEELRPDMGAGAYVNDFIKSTNPRFNNKSKEERRKMAIGAFMAAKSRLKEGTLQGNIGGGDAMNTTTSAPSASTAKDTTMGKKIKGFKFFNGENDKQMNMNQPVKEDIDQVEEGYYEKPASAYRRKGDEIGGGSSKTDVPFDGPYTSTFKKPNNPNRTGMDAARSLAQRSMDQLNKKKPVKEDAEVLDELHPLTYMSYHNKATAIGRDGEKAFDKSGKDRSDNIAKADKRVIDSVHGKGPLAKLYPTAKKTTLGKKAQAAVRSNAQWNEEAEELEEGDLSVRTLYNKFADAHVNGNDTKSTEKAITKVHGDVVMGHMKKAARANAKGDMDGEERHFDNAQTAAKKTDRIGGTVGRGRSEFMRKRREWSEEVELDEAKDKREYGYEGDMALNQLATLTRCAEMIKDTLKPDTDLPEWVQSKITLATDYIQTAADYLYSESEVNEETLDERNKANALMRKTMDASRGAKFKLKNPVPDADPKHKTARDHNVAIGRALRNEATTGNPGYGYHGQHATTHDADEAYKKIHAHVKSLTDSDDKTVKHYLDSAHGRHLVGHENDHDHIKKDFKKFSKYYKPEMHEATAQKGVNVDKVNHAGDTPHEEKWEPAPKTVSKLKKVKEENMKSYKEFLQGLDEKLIGKQHKIDKNKNGEVDAHDFELLRKEEADHLLEYTPGPDGKTIIKGRSYGADYVDPEGADETAADMKKKEKKPAGRKTGQSTGSYKPRATMSKLKSAGSTYK